MYCPLLMESLPRENISTEDDGSYGEIENSLLSVLPLALIESRRVFVGWKPSTENREPKIENQSKESSEVVWGPFVSASSSRLTLARPALAASLAGASARSSLGLRAHRQPDKPTLRLGTLSCLQHFFFVLLNQRFAIDPCSPSFPILRSGK
jgi:hypothetical protein